MVRPGDSKAHGLRELIQLNTTEVPQVPFFFLSEWNKLLSKVHGSIIIIKKE